MKAIVLILAAVTLAAASDRQRPPAPPPPPPETVKPFPKPDFVLRETDAPGRKGKSRNAGERGAEYGLDSIAFSGDGKTVALGTDFGRVDLWDTAARKELRTLDTHQGATIAALSPNGELLATGGDEPAYTIVIWETALGKRLKQFKGPAGTVDDLRFDPSGTRLDVGANGADNSVFDVFTGQLLAKFPGARFGRFSLDGSSLVTAGASRIIIWNTSDWMPVNSVPSGPDYPAAFAAFPEGGLAVVGGPKLTRVVRLNTGHEVARLGAGLAAFIAFNRDGSLIFAGIDAAIGIWDTNGKQYCSAPKSSNAIAALSPDDHWLAVAAASQTGVEVWDVQRLLAACGMARGGASGFPSD
ncbi:MAG TPA: hypothetical protein VGS20_05395 [Candidatus Acidoferrales bacterium]|nr:hypothetical protein [Candidatus Acidoferrales bacterium]